MKKKIISLLLIVSVIFTLCFAFSGCDENPKQSVELPKENIMVIINNGNDEYKVFDVNYKNAKLNENSSAYDVLVYLNAKNTLDFTLDKTFLKSIDKLNPPKDSNLFISIFTSDKENQDNSKFGKTENFLNLSATSSKYGIKELKVKKGSVLYFKMMTYNL